MQSRVTINISHVHYQMLQSLATSSGQDINYWFDLLLTDFFTYTNRARVLHNALIIKQLD